MAYVSFADETELESNIKKWNGKHVSDYDFVVVRYVGGTASWVPVLVKVRNGEVKSIQPDREPSELEKTEGYEDFATVEKCFDQIRDGYEHGVKLKVRYNDHLGYPESIIFDPKPETTDTTYSINITRFQILK